MQPEAPAGQAPSGSAKDRVNLPAILLIVTGGLGVLLALYGLVSGGQTPVQLPPDAPEQLRQLMAATQSGGRFFNIIPLVLSGVVIFGALKMRNLQSYGLAMAAAIIAMIPCLGPCCCTGLPVGIWALVVMSKPEVKSAFSRQ